eukprot:TRINITY_DN122_c0_g2_i1.p1 TRINITY_DN122_c0_g2~~TRINITY_DN122_c0_g2_i1.p1  ORF type:complete len:774 (+),score=180.24 TRINITY_DN122_c0_g2_i1:86-2407(+)
MLRCRALRQPGARLCRARFESSHAWDVVRTQKCYTLRYPESGFIAQFPHQKHWAIFQWAGGWCPQCMGFDGTLHYLSGVSRSPGFMRDMTVRRNPNKWKHGDRDGGDGRHGRVSWLNSNGDVGVKWEQTGELVDAPTRQLVPVHYPDGTAFDPELVLDIRSVRAIEKHPGSHPFSALNGDALSLDSGSNWVLFPSNEQLTVALLGGPCIQAYVFQQQAVLAHNGSHAGMRIDPRCPWVNVMLTAEDNHSGLDEIRNHSPEAWKFVHHLIQSKEADADIVKSNAERKQLQEELNAQRAHNAEARRRTAANEAEARRRTAANEAAVKVRKALHAKERKAETEKQAKCRQRDALRQEVSKLREQLAAAREGRELEADGSQQQEQNQDVNDHDEPQEDGLSAEVDHQQLQESLLELKEQLQEQCNAEQELRAVAERSEAAANAQISALTDQVQKLGAKVAESDKLIARHTAELSAAAAREQKLNSDLTAAKTAAAAREQKLSAELDQTKKDCSQRAVEAKSAAAREQKLSAELAEKEKDCAQRAAEVKAAAARVQELRAQVADQQGTCAEQAAKLDAAAKREQNLADSFAEAEKRRADAAAEADAAAARQQEMEITLEETTKLCARRIAAATLREHKLKDELAGKEEQCAKQAGELAAAAEREQKLSASIVGMRPGAAAWMQKLELAIKGEQQGAERAAGLKAAARWKLAAKGPGCKGQGGFGGGGRWIVGGLAGLTFICLLLGGNDRPMCSTRGVASPLCIADTTPPSLLAKPPPI